jgi:nicotinamidase-related amidase
MRSKDIIEREKIARNAAAAAERMKARGDKVTVVQDIRRRNAGRRNKDVLDCRLVLDENVLQAKADLRVEP